MSLNGPFVLVLVSACVPLLFAAGKAPRQTTWTFDRLDRIGGMPVKVEGNPKVVDAPAGKAIEFDGVEDAIWIPAHPLAGARTFTFEAIFRPDGGAKEQRWFHLAERTPQTGLLASPDHLRTGQDENSRILFELRVAAGDRWFLDAFVNGPGYSKALMFNDKLHRIGEWYHVAQVFDGRRYSSFVNGELQGEAEIAFKPQGPGASSVGVRINRVNYFHGAVARARFTPRALAVTEFMSLAVEKK